jgi:hypothetical protein
MYRHFGRQHECELVSHCDVGNPRLETHERWKRGLRQHLAYRLQKIVFICKLSTKLFHRSSSTVLPI